ncbi:hypothetical protein U1Q18_031576 [Sarracenia purpurea var. burkii]
MSVFPDPQPHHVRRRLFVPGTPKRVLAVRTVGMNQIAVGGAFSAVLAGVVCQSGVPNEERFADVVADLVVSR